MRIFCCHALRNVTLTLGEVTTHHGNPIRAHAENKSRQNAGNTGGRNTDASNGERNEEITERNNTRVKFGNVKSTICSSVGTTGEEGNKIIVKADVHTPPVTEVT